MHTHKLLSLAAATAVVFAAGAASATSAEAKPKTKVKTITVRASAPGIQAKLTTQRVTKGQFRTYRKLRLRVRTDNRKWGKALVVSGNGSTRSYTRPMVSIGDLNGDRVPDVWVTGFTGGAHCCTTMASALSTGPNSWTKPKSKVWAHGFQAKDLDGDGTFEVIGSDARFDYEFTSHAGSSWPVVIHKAKRTKFYDASTAYPAVLRADADTMRSRWNGLAHDGGAARGALAAALADLLRLGAFDEARAWVSEAEDRGDLDDTGDDVWDSGVGTNLVKWGYLEDYSLIGLSR